MSLWNKCVAFRLGNRRARRNGFLRPILLAALLSVGAIAGAVAQSAVVDVQHAWARATPPGAKTAAIYMTLLNHGPTDDRLLSVSTPVADKAEVHTTVSENGISRMRPAGPLTVAPGSPVELKPGGYHIMLMDLKAPLAAGQSVAVSLTFEKAGKIDTTAVVEKAGSMGPNEMPGMKM